MISPYPKIHTLGHRDNNQIFEGMIEITEKIDGSQFVFGKVNNIVYCRSKGVELLKIDPNDFFASQLLNGASDGMFTLAVDWVINNNSKFPNNTVFYGEYLQKPKHNCLKYDRVPKHNIILYSANEVNEDGSFFAHTSISRLEDLSESLDLEVVPVLARYYANNETQDLDALSEYLNLTSVLGGEKIEGVVIQNTTNYQRAKYVSERFKERHGEGKIKPLGNNWETFTASFRSNEARWLKAVQHLNDKGQLLQEAKDIGPLIKEVQNDIIEEHYDEIKEALHKHFVNPLLTSAVAGLPEWYKKELVANLLTDEEYDKIGC